MSSILFQIENRLQKQFKSNILIGASVQYNHFYIGNLKNHYINLNTKPEDLKMSSLNKREDRSNGRWTKEEHQKFLLGLQVYGKNWKKIEELLGTRTGSQIRSHAQKYFLKAKKVQGNSQSDMISDKIDFPEQPLTVIQKHTDFQEKLKNQHSFFMSILQNRLKATNGNSDFNFWEEFIDFTHSKKQTEENQINLRKNSFITMESNSQVRQESVFTCFMPISQIEQ